MWTTRFDRNYARARPIERESFVTMCEHGRQRQLHEKVANNFSGYFGSSLLFGNYQVCLGSVGLVATETPGREIPTWALEGTCACPLHSLEMFVKQNAVATFLDHNRRSSRRASTHGDSARVQVRSDATGGRMFDSTRSRSAGNAQRGAGTHSTSLPREVLTTRKEVETSIPPPRKVIADGASGARNARFGGRRREVSVFRPASQSGAAGPRGRWPAAGREHGRCRRGW